MALHDRKLLVVWGMDPRFNRLSILRTIESQRPGPVVYWMQASQRTKDNYALSWALLRAKDLSRPLRIVWIGMGNLPDAPDSSYEFMRQGLAELVPILNQWNIPMDVLILSRDDQGRPTQHLAHYLKARDACLLVCDHGPLRWQRDMREEVCMELDAINAGCSVQVVEANTVVPVETLADSALWSAASARPRIHRLYARIFANSWKNESELVADLQLVSTSPSTGSLPTWTESLPAWTSSLPAWTDSTILLDRQAFFDRLGRRLPPIPIVQGGQELAQKRFDSFLADGLPGYAQQRSDPLAEAQSGLSPYLHFGQIGVCSLVRQLERHLQLLVGSDHATKDTQSESPSLLLDRLLTAEKENSIPALSRTAGFLPGSSAHLEGIAAFFEELVVRRELAVNWVWFNPDYDRYKGLPRWAKETLEFHRLDPRPYVYTMRELEQAQTHDPYWNAAQRQMMQTGSMHGYMRMYWGKKILEWSTNPEQGFYTALKLNNTWMLDGRDANGYAGVAWCFGAHDRPWTERAIFGTVRYMNDKGLERKFKIKTWAQRWLEEARDDRPFS